MRTRWVLVLIVLFAAFTWALCKRPVRKSLRANNESEVSEETGPQNNENRPTKSEQIELMQRDPVKRATPQLAQAPTPSVTEPTPQPTANPYHIDPFSVRRLDLPLPKSLNELLGKLTEYEDPMLPVVIPGRPTEGDGDVLISYRGYFETTNGDFRRIALSRSTSGVDVAIENSEKSSHGFSKWFQRRGELSLKNFNGDPYSLVVFLPDKRMIYMKFHTGVDIPEYGHTCRTMTGYLLSHSTPIAKVSRLVMIADYTDDIKRFKRSSNPSMSKAGRVCAGL